MDREFIIKNQIVERYLAGRLPPKGVTDFEKLIRSRPQLIEELGLADKVNAGLRLLDAAGIAEPWAEKEKKAWEKPVFTMGAAALAIAALIGCAVLGMQVSSRNAIIAKQKLENLERPIAPSTRKRTSSPSMRSWGADPVVRCRSLAFFSTMTFRSCCRLMPLGAPAVAIVDPSS
jgi:hypothetical protein